MPQPITIVVHQLASGDVVLGITLFLLLWTVTYWGGRWSGFLRPAGWRERSARLAWQLGALLGLEQAYEFTRGQIPYTTDIALLNAYRLLDIEWQHGLFVEARIERFFLQFHNLMNAIDIFYLLSHVVVTIGVLAWIYVRRPSHYPFVRNLMMVTTAIALVAFYLYPTAPPRLLTNYGFVDPLQLHHLVGAGGAQPGSYTYNPYAAMPSLHVGYALAVSWGLYRSIRSLPLRILTFVYPLCMGAAVVISGNHWLLDVAGAVATVALAGTMVLLATWLRPVVWSAVYRAVSEHHNLAT
jgi:membrane-associated phospholipid phosphatase